MTRLNEKSTVLRNGNRIFVNVVCIHIDFLGWNLGCKNRIFLSIQSKDLDQILPLDPHSELSFGDKNHDCIVIGRFNLAWKGRISNRFQNVPISIHDTACENESLKRNKANSLMILQDVWTGCSNPGNEPSSRKEGPSPVIPFRVILGTHVYGIELPNGVFEGNLGDLAVPVTHHLAKLTHYDQINSSDTKVAPH